MAGEWDVGRIERGLTARRFAEWEAYARIDPFGQAREDYHFARLLQMLYNVNRGKHDKAKSAEDFLLKFQEPKRKQTPQEQFAILTLLARVQAMDSK